MSHICRSRTIVVLTVLCAAAPCAFGAPLDILGTHVELGINGRAIASPAYPTMPSDSPYQATLMSDRFTDERASLAYETRVGGTPSLGDHAVAGSGASARFEQVALNQYTVTLGGTARGIVQKGSQPPLTRGDYTANGRSSITTQLRIGGLQGQPQGAPSTILLRLEHVGTLSSLNGGAATMFADATLSASGNNTPFKYSNRLDLNAYPPSGFDDYRVEGSRNYRTDVVLYSSVGQTITLTANLDVTAKGGLTAQDPLLRRGSDTGFEGGLRLHLTVLPEPATLLPMLIGACWLRRKGRR